MRALSEHWIAYPSFIAGDLGCLERAKLRILGRPRVRFIDTVLPQAVATASPAGEADFVLVVAGGGTAHPGAREAPQIIGEAAAGLAARGFATVLVGVADSVAAALGPELLTRLPRLAQPQLLDLMQRARIVVSNGGDTLLQALACASACVAVPIAHDQAARIARCRELRLIETAPLQAAAIADAVVRLNADEPQRQALIARARAAGIKDATPQILEWIAALVAAEPRR
jgi:UDP:flavonoid glycosyltransferase YjiC (YdhE family)